MSANYAHPSTFLVSPTSARPIASAEDVSVGPSDSPFYTRALAIAALVSVGVPLASIDELNAVSSGAPASQAQLAAWTLHHDPRIVEALIEHRALEISPAAWERLWSRAIDEAKTGGWLWTWLLDALVHRFADLPEVASCFEAAQYKIQCWTEQRDLSEDVAAAEALLSFSRGAAALRARLSRQGPAARARHHALRARIRGPSAGQPPPPSRPFRHRGGGLAGGPRARES